MNPTHRPLHGPQGDQPNPTGAASEIERIIAAPLTELNLHQKYARLTDAARECELAKAKAEADLDSVIADFKTLEIWFNHCQTELSSLRQQVQMDTVRFAEMQEAGAKSEAENAELKRHRSDAISALQKMDRINSENVAIRAQLEETKK